MIIDDFDNDVEENLLYSIINLANQDNKYLIISSPISLKKFKIELKDLNSRFTSFIEVGIDLPTDDLIKVILTKNFSDKQITISKKNIDNLINGIERKIKKKEQVFWILPNIGNNEEFIESDSDTVLSRFNYLKDIFKVIF